MTKRVPKIILDRSIFHGDKFGQLQSSKLALLASAGRIQVYYTPLFLEESLRHGVLGAKNFGNQMAYIFGLNSKNWFKLSDAIFESELDQSAPVENYHMIAREDIERTIMGTEEFLQGLVSSQEIDQALNETRSNRQGHEKLRSLRLEMRQTLGRTDVGFEDYMNSDGEFYLENGIIQNLKSPEKAREKWNRDRESCPFTLSYLRAWLAIPFLSQSDHQLKLHPNDLNDSIQLAYLLWADVMISDDRFMKTACNVLYPNGGKKCMDLPELIEFMKAL